MQKILNSPWTTVALIALLAIFGIQLMTRSTENLRLDMTSDDLYSLSEGTHAILDKIRAEGVQPLEITLYFSETTGKTLPSFIKDFVTYEKYLRALLKEYARASEGKVRLHFIDPVPDSDEAQDALDFGLDGKAINQYGDLFFFGLVFETQTGTRDVIDFLWPARQKTIEYEISKKMHGLIWPQRQRIGVLSSLEVLSGADPYLQRILQAQGQPPREPWIAAQLLNDLYEVKQIDREVDTISTDEYDMVVVIHPKNLLDKALFALDEWIVRGGNALIFLDPFAIDDQAPQNPQQPWTAWQHKPASDFSRLLDVWGLEREDNQIAADFDLAVVRPLNVRGGSERVLVDLAIDDQTAAMTLDPGHPIFDGVTNVRFFLAGSLKAKDGSGDNGAEGAAEGDSSGGSEDGEPGTEVTQVNGVIFTPLAKTTSQGGTLTVTPGFPNPRGPELTFADINQYPGKLLDQFQPEGEVVLAYMLQGKMPSAFPEGGDFPASVPPPPPGLPPGINLPPPEGGEMIHKDPVPDSQRSESTVMVFADVDLISDQIAFQRSIFGPVASNDNHKILLNAIDYLLGSEELMKVRAKKPIERPFTLFDEIEAEADRQTLERERELRAEIARFEEELGEKQSTMGARNAALFQKQLQDEVDELNGRILEANRELREIRKQKRKALEGEESFIRWTTLWLMPALVLILGLVLVVQRRKRDALARRNQA